MKENKYPAIPSMEEIVKKGMEGQRTILDAQLANGVPLVYDDENGNFVEEHPDGTIVILKRADEEIHA